MSFIQINDATWRMVYRMFFLGLKIGVPSSLYTKA